MKLRFIAIAVVLLGFASCEPIFAQTNQPPATNVTSVSSNSIATTGPVEILAGDAVGVGLTWIAQHGSAGAEYSGPLKGGKNGGTGPAVTETAWVLDAAWTSKTATNVDFKFGIMHADVVTKTVTEDQFGIELDEAFFNDNIAAKVSKVPVIGVIAKALAHWDVELQESVAENTDYLSKAKFSDERTDWGVGVKFVKLY